jgi:hypothetical protein
MENKISWHVLEYKKKEKTADWYWAVGIIAVSISIISIFMHNIFFAVLIIIAVGTLLIFSVRDPKIVEVELSDKGIRVDKNLYSYVSLEAFWVDGSQEREEKIILKSKKAIMPLIIVPIEEYSHEDIRRFLLEKITEKEMEEPLSQKVMDKLGF